MAEKYNSSLNRYRRYLATVSERPLWLASLYLALSLGLVIILLVTALRPTVVTIGKLIGDIEKQKTLDQKMALKIAQIQQAQQNYQQVQDRLRLVDEALPMAADFGQLGSDLVAMASASGLLVHNVQIGEVRIATGSGEMAVKFTMNTEGEYEGIRQFVKEVESWRRLVSLDQMAINQHEGTRLRLDLAGVAGYMIYEQK